MTNPNEIRKAETVCGILPIGSKVIIKASFEVSSLMINDKDLLSKLSPYKVEVAAFGDQTHTINIGDEIISSKRPIQMERIDIDGNEQSISKTIDNYQCDTLIGISKTYYMYEYFVHDFMDIIGVINNK